MNSFHFFWCTSKWKQVHWRSNNQTTPRKGKVCCVCQAAQSQEYRGEETLHKQSWTESSKSINPTAGQVSVRFLRGGSGEALPECYKLPSACYLCMFLNNLLETNSMRAHCLSVRPLFLQLNHRTPELTGLPLVPCSLHGFAFIQFYLRMQQYTATVNSKHIVF